MFCDFFLGVEWIAQTLEKKIPPGKTEAPLKYIVVASKALLSEKGMYKKLIEMIYDNNTLNVGEKLTQINQLLLFEAENPDLLHGVKDEGKKSQSCIIL